MSLGHVWWDPSSAVAPTLCRNRERVSPARCGQEIIIARYGRAASQTEPRNPAQPMPDEKPILESIPDRGNERKPERIQGERVATCMRFALKRRAAAGR